MYVAGYVTGQLGCGSGGAADAFVRKYDGSGNELWTYQYGGPGFEQAFAIGIHSSRLFVAGAQINPTTSFDAFVLALDLNGKPLWVQVLQNTVANEYAQGVFADWSGNAIVVGYDGTLNANEAFIAKLAP